MSDPSLIDTPVGQIAMMIAGAVAGLSAWAAAWMRGTKTDAPAATPNPVFPQDARFFFDGPIGRALEFLQGIYRNSAESRNEFVRAKDELRGDLGEIIDLLRNGQRGSSRRTRRRRS